MHMKKKFTFHGVDYIAVPITMWEEVRRVIDNHWFSSDEEGNSYNNDEEIEISTAMDEYSKGDEIV